MIPKKAIPLGIAAALACLACQAKSAGPSLTIKPGVLTVGMAIEYPPMEYYAPGSKTPMGFDVEMAKAIAAKMGLQAEFVDTAWDGIFAGVDTGKYDCVISAVTITDARLAAHNFSK
ncbi:MAG: transporter substrate-binding domain-containing protein, partial [Treponema sp.]|nr:transporter substrate-binding domain-containing protein [Treponema sp.]